MKRSEIVKLINDCISEYMYTETTIDSTCFGDYLLKILEKHMIPKERLINREDYHWLSDEDYIDICEGQKINKWEKE